ncbi:hypothetical protein [Alkalicoccus saliphilus]|jgi:hypothetical protein|uniref:Small peptidoglycan-associated lipoprotein n=1 Tax=Alkalicoccus saliphilus TaxID=200989 RepID=A0A2T4U9B8_9BACI|nr:hypothetical protein [Alkalicoccus saliphilus]PTL39985.1 hypothetical protein C6Y45_03160 [Alkalicoccus saliphilus]
MKIIFISFLFMIVCTSGCGSENIYDSLPELADSDNLHAVVFIEDIDDEANHAYFDALLAINAPSSMETHVMPAGENEAAAEHFQVESYPSLVLIEKEDVRLKIEGSNPFDFIQQKLYSEVNKFTSEREEILPKRSEET